MAAMQLFAHPLSTISNEKTIFLNLYNKIYSYTHIYTQHIHTSNNTRSHTTWANNTMEKKSCIYIVLSEMGIVHMKQMTWVISKDQ